MQNSTNLLPKDKFFNWLKLKVFADNKMNETENFILGTVENIAGKGENAGYQHFLLFPECFPKGSSAGSLKVLIIWQKDEHIFRIVTEYNMPLEAFTLHVIWIIQ